MSTELSIRNSGVSCLHDALVQSIENGVLGASKTNIDIVNNLPDNFPMHSVNQLCTMLETQLHVNCAAHVALDEPVVYLFGPPEPLESIESSMSHAELLRPYDLYDYLEERGSRPVIGYIAFKGVDCSPYPKTPERHHDISVISPLSFQLEREDT